MPESRPTAALKGRVKIFAVVHRRRGKYDAAEHRPARSDEQTEEDDGLEGNVGGEKVWNRGSDPDAQGEGNEEEGQQRQGLPRAAFLGEEQAAEGAGARKHAGNGGYNS